MEIELWWTKRMVAVDDRAESFRTSLLALVVENFDDDDDDDELTFSLTTECVATISELGAKCERYSFRL